MIDNTWGVTIIVFQILVFKMSRGINEVVKKNQSNGDREKERSNIINIMANHHRLISGCFKKELEQIKFFVKENLNITNISR